MSRPTEKKSQRKLAKYGITEAEFLSMLDRQRSLCAGCNKSIDDYTAIIDNKLHGLLCDQCNIVLGFVKDRSNLYQLAAYLELDRSKPVVYLGGSLRNPNIVSIGNSIRELGLEVFDNWFAAGKIADDSWQEYSNTRGRTYQEALSSREAQHVFYFDRAYISLSDAFVLVYPAGKSTHLELGWAIGKGKRGYMLMEDKPDRYDVMLQFAGSPLFHDRESLLLALKKDLL